MWSLTVFLFQHSHDVQSSSSLLAMFLCYFHEATPLPKQEYETTSRAFTQCPALQHISNVSYYHATRLNMNVSWRPKTELQMFTMGIVSKTYHSSSLSRAKFHSCDDGHLVRPELGNVFNAANLC